MKNWTCLECQARARGLGTIAFGTALAGTPHLIAATPLSPSMWASLAPFTIAAWLIWHASRVMAGCDHGG